MLAHRFISSQDSPESAAREIRQSPRHTKWGTQGMSLRDCKDISLLYRLSTILAQSSEQVKALQVFDLFDLVGDLT